MCCRGVRIVALLSGGVAADRSGIRSGGRADASGMLAGRFASPRHLPRFGLAGDRPHVRSSAACRSIGDERSVSERRCFAGHRPLPRELASCPSTAVPYSMRRSMAFAALAAPAGLPGLRPAARATRRRGSRHRSQSLNVPEYPAFDGISGRSSTGNVGLITDPNSSGRSGFERSARRGSSEKLAHSTTSGAEIADVADGWLSRRTQAATRLANPPRSIAGSPANLHSQTNFAQVCATDAANICADALLSLFRQLDQRRCPIARAGATQLRRPAGSSALPGNAGRSVDQKRLTLDSIRPLA